MRFNHLQALANTGLAAVSLDRWYHAVRKAQWRNFSDLRATFSSADQVGKFVVFKIGGNKYRLIAQIYFNQEQIHRLWR